MSTNGGGGGLASHFLGSDAVVDEGDEAGDEAADADSSDDDDDEEDEFLSSSASNGNLFGLDSPSAARKSAPATADPQPAESSASASIGGGASMADYEQQLSAMKADFERRVAAEREMTLRRKAELLTRRESTTAARLSEPTASTRASATNATATAASAAASAGQQQYTPMVVEETLTEEAFEAELAADGVDPARAYYEATLAEGPSDLLKHRMLPLINASRRDMSLAEVGETEAVRLQANLAIMRETMLGRRKAIEDVVSDWSENDDDDE